jgi:Ala-tRNA(Pro) deacylase
MDCRERLETYLRAQGITFDVQQHKQAFTAREIAESEHIAATQLAKVVILLVDQRPVMLVLPGSYRVDVQRVGQHLRAREARLAREDEFAGIFPDCERGAMPPFGNLYNVPVYVDRTLATNETIVCQAGTHTDTISLRYADWDRLVHPTVDDFVFSPQEADALRWHPPAWTT